MGQRALSVQPARVVDHPAVVNATPGLDVRVLRKQRGVGVVVEQVPPPFSTFSSSSYLSSRT